MVGWGAENGRRGGSADRLLRQVGRRVLTGTLSLAVTTSLVPYPTAWALPEVDAPKADAADGEADSNADSNADAEGVPEKPGGGEDSATQQDSGGQAGTEDGDAETGDAAEGGSEADGDAEGREEPDGDEEEPDHTPPELTLSMGGEPCVGTDGIYESRTATLRTEKGATLALHVRKDGERIVLPTDDPDWCTWSEDGTELTVRFPEGRYSDLMAYASNSAGKSSKSSTDGAFTVDATAPVLEAVSSQGVVAENQRTPRRYTFTVRDANFDAGSMLIVNERADANESLVSAGDWHRVGEDIYQATVECGSLPGEDGRTYQLKISGTDAAGHELELAEGISAETSPFVVDATGPRVTIVGPGDVRYFDDAKTAPVTVLPPDLGGGEDPTRWRKDYFSTPTYWQISVTDRYFDPVNSTIDGVEAPWKLSIQDMTGEISYPATVPADPVGLTTGTYRRDYMGDGDYRTPEIHIQDVAGNEGVGEAYEHYRSQEFTIDTVAPHLAGVEWVNYGVTDPSKNMGTEGAPVAFFRHGQSDVTRSLKVTVDERNLDAAKSVVTVTRTDATVMGGTAGARQEVTSENGWASAAEDASATTNELTIDFSKDGQYEVAASLWDLAGHSELHDQLVDSFVVDNTPPAVSAPTFHRKGEDGTLRPIDRAEFTPNGTTYFAEPVYVEVMVTDRNLDAESIEVDFGPACTQVGGWVRGETNSDGTYTYTGLVEYGEADDGSTCKPPRVRATDRAGNVGQSPADGSVTFCVDLTAPEVTAAATSDGPVFSAEGGGYQFFNGSKFARPTLLTISYEDVHPIKDVSLEDPNGVYAVEKSIAEAATRHADGSYRGQVSIRLQDGVDVQADAEFDKRIVLKVTDAAGNVRTWSTSQMGTVSGWKAAAVANASINGGGVFPERLIEDHTAPVVELTGPDADSYSNSDQVVRATVDEFNFPYLQRFDPQRPVLTVKKREADASGTLSSWEVPCSSFTSDGEGWKFDQTFDEDGHYSVLAQVVDLAGNSSEEVSLGEFTIDKTAPKISIGFDNEDVRNGRYYDSARVATVTVDEHDFDPSLFTVETEGTVGAWTSDGDTHTCRVAFDADGTYHLSVSGRDLAGNEATPVDAPEFVIDQTAPSIDLGGMAKTVASADATVPAESGALEDRHAYNGTVAPRISFSDEANLDAGTATWRIVGGKNGDVTDAFVRSVTENGGAKVVQYADLGRLGDSETGESSLPYGVGADDVYAVTAEVSDLAGNTTRESMVFSVNRFGSNYLISVVDDGRQVEPDVATLLSEAPTITVHEINVSGASSEASQGVLKEHASVTTPIERDDSGAASGYGLEALPAEESENPYGWAEYVYTIRSGNFGKGSDSDSGDGGQGRYRVNVTSDDLAGNANSTASYWSSDVNRVTAEAKRGTVDFTLDQVAPAVVDVNVPEGVVVGNACQASFTIRDSITNGNEVQVRVDGKLVNAAGPADGRGTYTFDLPARSLVRRNVEIVVTDYAGRRDSVIRKGFYVTNLIPEGLTALTLAGVVAWAIWWHSAKGKERKQAASAR